MGTSGKTYLQYPRTPALRVVAQENSSPGVPRLPRLLISDNTPRYLGHSGCSSWKHPGTSRTAGIHPRNTPVLGYCFRTSGVPGDRSRRYPQRSGHTLHISRYLGHSGCSLGNTRTPRVLQTLLLAKYSGDRILRVQVGHFGYPSFETLRRLG